MAMEKLNLWAPSADADHVEPQMLLKLSRMSAFPKADVQNVRIEVEPNVCFWPKADVRCPLFGDGRLK